MSNRIFKSQIKNYSQEKKFDQKRFMSLFTGKLNSQGEMELPEKGNEKEKEKEQEKIDEELEKIDEEQQEIDEQVQNYIKEAEKNQKYMDLQEDQKQMEDLIKEIEKIEEEEQEELKRMEKLENETQKSLEENDEEEESSDSQENELYDGSDTLNDSFDSKTTNQITENSGNIQNQQKKGDLAVGSKIMMKLIDDQQNQNNNNKRENSVIVNGNNRKDMELIQQQQQKISKSEQNLDNIQNSSGLNSGNQVKISRFGEQGQVNGRRGSVIKKMGRRGSVLVINNGKIVSDAEELRNLKNLRVSVKGKFSEEIQQNLQSYLGNQRDLRSILESKSQKIQQKDDKQIQKQIEESEFMNPNWSIYKTYLKACGIIKAFLILILFFGSEILAVFITRSYGFFKEQEQSDSKEKSKVTLIVYLIFGNFVCNILKSIFLTYTTRAGSTKLHNNMIQRVMMSKINFFFNNSIGNIMTRFSNDVNVCDGQLTKTLYEILELSIKFLLYTISVGTTNYYILIAGFFASFLFYFIFSFSSRGVKQMGSMELIHSAPINTIFGETLENSLTIRNYNIRNLFENKARYFIDALSRTSIVSWDCNRFLQFYGDFVALLFSISGIILLVALANDNNNGVMSSSIEMLLAITDNIQYIFRYQISLNLEMTSVARIRSFLDIPIEGRLFQLNDTNLLKNGWPQEGKIELKNVWFRISNEQDYKLKGMSFKIEPGEKVAILGKSGGGKSTLFYLIQRLFEVDSSKDSQILIDDLDISEVGLNLLRKSIMYIPQFPNLMEIPLRKNLDPFNIYTDAQIWEALSQFNLDKFVQKLPDQLEEYLNDHEISAGKRQLIFFAKAYLYKTQIILFDEPSANFDIDTEQFLKTKINQSFKGVTIITIAHRLLTIADYDKVIILGKGKVMDIGCPYQLLVKNEKDSYITNRDGNFSKLVRKDGILFATDFFKKAKFHYLQRKKMKVLKEKERLLEEQKNKKKLD
ncbi:P-loop containing nucleoside triphosphate hydrolase [Pseudocohnilembus persalinus]|uniref:p-loop containing nucleoside triphosphate hydrolase n=1 Tax=Pseudocohnilembus persalinus TaxID=266149 RepID=A0A0V0QL65_PSEPJ|nr:P-loop containing nucleoside triphosphate hydrolase [Pseudocohnilembus persalinus]|eukprot:KRX02736.1 P-loop containing nucleoside triphosphate hydrolase [Pseudocohnilembus persalinus]